MSINLRPYQTQLIADIYAQWNAGMRNVLAVSPTGSGKAFTLCSLAQQLAFTYGMPTVIKVHRKELVSQLCVSLASLGIAHNIIAQKGTILEIMEEQRREFRKSFYDHRSVITVVSVDTLLARQDKYESWALQQRAWILDEAAHQLKDNKWGQVAAMFPNAVGVGFTATPQRLDKKGLGRHAFGLFDAMVLGPSVMWLIQNGFLSKYKIVVPKSDYRQYLQDDGSETKDYTAKARNYASLHSHIIGDVVTNYLKFIPGKQVIVFADSIEAGERMEAEFRSKGVEAKLLTGETPSKERAAGVLAYREGKIKALINVDLFDEGFDVPGTDAVIMARPTKSLSKYLQCFGRALRVAKGKEVAIVIDHVGNVQYHGLPDKRRMWTLDNIIRRRERVELLRICHNETCNQPYDRALTECPYCGQAHESYRRSPEMSPREALKIVDGDMALLDPETIRELEKELDLESPEAIAHRVAAAAGPLAGASARKKQQERIDMQQTVAQAIAQWAGREKHYGYTDRQIKKRFMLQFGESITGVLSLPKAEMEKYLNEINGTMGVWA